MIRHFAQRRLTDAETFMPPPSPFSQAFFLAGRSPKPIGDPPPRQVVRRKLDTDPVTRQNTDEMHPQAPRYVRQYLVAIVQLHAKHRVRQRLGDGPFDFDDVLLRHKTPHSRAIARTHHKHELYHSRLRLRENHRPIVTHPDCMLEMRCQTTIQRHDRPTVP